VSCLGVYNDGASTWAQWDTPWIGGVAGAGYSSWVAEQPSSRELVIAQDLIPTGLANINDPLSWEQSCAAGDFDSYATTFASNLVAAGLQNSVIRLGPEMNGPWEHDFVGTSTQEQNLWATCFANEVTSMRKAPGEHLLIDWNVNACTETIPYANFYPGNAYVDILGLDLYDQGCDSPNKALTFSQLSSETYGLTSFEAFAAAQGKPMSFPEWGLVSGSGNDDPSYITAMASSVNNGNFAFQEYFDVVDGGTMMLDTGNTPLSDAAYHRTFGS
jgi:beta-mannanase